MAMVDIQAAKTQRSRLLERVLGGTHDLLWCQIDSPRLSERARSILTDGSSTLSWSAASS